jgi:hypothetical protein
MAGSVDLVERVFTGIVVEGDVLRLNISIRYRGHSLDLQLTRDALTVRGRYREAPSFTLSVESKAYAFVEGGTVCSFPLKKRRIAD